ncbi:MAG: AMP-dependent synthetase/ligase [Proteobacteria bacterium]|nr:AMP-dependent synthetase/ligase [Pseudomonadota bacterium]
MPIDLTPLLSIRPAPHAVFGRLSTHRDRPRFHVRDGAAWTPVTWGQYATQIRGVARWLVDHDVAAGDRIAIYAPNSVAWASASIGAQTAGAVFVPIYPASTAEQVAFILDHAEAKVIFVAGREQVTRLERARTMMTRAIAIVDLDDADGALAAAAQRDAASPALVDARLAALELDAPAQMLYTSGTSGNPKGVPLTHRNVGTNGADWLVCNHPLLEEGDVDLLWLPMSHIFGFGELCVGNLLGYETYLCTPAEVFELMPVIRPQVFFSVPAYWEKIARSLATGTDVTGGRLRFCLSGGAGLKIEIKQQLHAAGVLVIEGYGLTETSPTLTLNRPDAFRFDTVGKVLPSVQLKLADDGEILARGDSVFTGYFKDPEATAGAFTADGWFCTGDVGRFTEDGFLQIVDRKKDILVNSGGKNIPPANIEAKFVDDPVIERLVVYGDARPYLVAAVWVRPEAPAAAVAARIEAVNAELARHETIKKFFVAEAPLTVESGGLTSSLKLRRKAVYQMMKDRFEGLYT